MTLWLLFYEFIKIGLFSFGGGYATLPFLYNLTTRYPWFDAATLGKLIAIAEVTPGPVGINVATYAGYLAGGVLGGVIASVSLVLPAFCIVVFLAKRFPNFHAHPIVIRAFYGLRPVVAAMVTMALWQIVRTAYGALTQGWDCLFGALLLVGLLLLSFKWKASPFLLLGIGALWGILLL